MVGTYPKELLPQITPIFLQQDLQVSEQGWTILRVAETELDAGGHEAGGITEVMADPIVDYNVDGVAPETRNATASISCSSPPFPGVIQRRTPKIARS